MNKPKIFIAIPHTGQIRSGLFPLLLEWFRKGEYQISLHLSKDRPTSSNRNRIVREFLNDKDHYDYLLMIDSDIVPPSNVLNLVDYKKDIIGALYFINYENIVPMVYKKLSMGESEWWKSKNKYRVILPSELANDKLIECDALGMGCIMIARKVLEHPKMKAPFKEYFDDDGVLLIGEDVAFCKRIQDLGFKIYCHSDYICSHYNEMDLKIIADTMRPKIRGNINLSEKETETLLEKATRFFEKKK